MPPATYWTFAAASQGVLPGQTVNLFLEFRAIALHGVTEDTRDPADENTTHPAQGSARLTEPVGLYLYSLVLAAIPLARRSRHRSRSMSRRQTVSTSRG